MKIFPKILSCLSLIKSFFQKNLRYYMHTYPLTTFVSTIVFMLHLAAVIYMTVQKAPPPLPLPTKLAIHTTMLPKETLSIGTKTLSSHFAPATNSTKSQKTSPSKKTPTSKLQTTTKQKSSTITTKDPKKEKLLKQLQESLSKLEEKSAASSTSTLHIPKEIKELKAITSFVLPDNLDETLTNEYHHILVDYLRHMLTLPAAGVVKAKITLKSNGSCQDIKIIASDSEVNRLYLEKHLQDLLFPPFSHELEKQESYTFSLTFCGE